MVYERAQLPIRSGAGPDFEQAMISEGLGIIRAAKGCEGAHLARGVEEPDTYLLLVRWDEIASHGAFAETPEFGPFKELVGAYVSGPPEVLHFEIAD